LAHASIKAGGFGADFNQQSIGSMLFPRAGLSSVCSS
jgi:hypothetical protein